MKRDKRHWFHCTQDDHGDRWTAARMPPPHRGIEEPLTPRLCVAPCVAGCLAAKYWTRGRRIHVYRTAMRRAIRPVGVWDASITGERWLVPPVELVRVATLNSMYVIDAMPWLVRISGVTVHERADWVVNMHEVVREHLPAFASVRHEELATEIKNLVDARMPRETAKSCTSAVDDWMGDEAEEAA